MPVRAHHSFLVLAALASGCHPGEPRATPASPAPTAAQASAATVPPGPAGPAPLAVSPPDDAPAVPTSDAPASAGHEAPAKPPQKIATWPFTAWDRAEAIAFNHVAYGPGIALRAYDEAHGWSPKIALRRPISGQQGARAAEWVIATRGEIEVSKCAFPRHAVVFYAGDTPVGSVNVCFECGDILVWPEFEPAPGSQKQQERRTRQQLAAYKQVFPRWERLFRDELGFSLAPVERP